MPILLNKKNIQGLPVAEHVNYDFVKATTPTDLYLIRRFLDKDYIKNGIVYTGDYHLNDILYILVNYFNFKLNNSYYINGGSIKEINKSIPNLNCNNLNYIKQLAKYFFNYENNIVNQCVNLFDFPDNFS